LSDVQLLIRTNELNKTLRAI